MAKKTISKRPPTKRPAAAPLASTAEQQMTPPDPQRLRQNAPAPMCPYHKCACESKRSEPFFTRYYCPTERCTYSQKVPRPDVRARLSRARAQESDHSAR